MIGDSGPEEHAAEQTSEVTRSWLVKKPVTVTLDSGVTAQSSKVVIATLEVVSYICYPTRQCLNQLTSSEGFCHLLESYLHMILVSTHLCIVSAVSIWCIVYCCIVYLCKHFEGFFHSGGSMWNLLAYIVFIAHDVLHLSVFFVL